MTLTCQWETPAGVLLEIIPLLEMQQAEMGANYEPYDPNWEKYDRLDQAGSLDVWTARVEGKLVGYIVWLLITGLHNASTKFATNDLIYAVPEWRKGMRGYKFLRDAIEAVEDKHSPDLINVETCDLFEDGRLGLLLKRLNFRKIGSLYQRRSR